MTYQLYAQKFLSMKMENIFIGADVSRLLPLFQWPPKLIH